MTAFLSQRSANKASIQAQAHASTSLCLEIRLENSLGSDPYRSFLTPPVLAHLAKLVQTAFYKEPQVPLHFIITNLLGDQHTRGVITLSGARKQSNYLRAMKCISLPLWGTSTGVELRVPSCISLTPREGDFSRSRLDH